MKKWYTCTPVSFDGDHTFFSRDSGLFCKAFQKNGCESMAVMPLPIHEGDDEDLLRTEYANLEDPKWWKSLGLDGVLLYSWGAPQYVKVAQAIHESGTKLLVYLDMSKGFYPFYSWKENTLLMYSIYRRLDRKLWPVRFAFRLFTRNVLGPFFTDIRRKRHLSYADAILIPLPNVIEQLGYPNIFYGHLFAKKMFPVGSPTADYFTYNGREKENRVVAIGRWDDYLQKRPLLLMETLERVLLRDDKMLVTIVGKGIEQMELWLKGLPDDLVSRVTLFERKTNHELIEIYRASQVCLCSSEWEGTHVVSTEALCCGCSVVAPDKPGMSAFKWYVSENSGTLSKEDNPESLAEALLSELLSWKQGDRDPGHISCIWRKRFHATESVKRILEWDETGVMPGFEDCSG